MMSKALSNSNSNTTNIAQSAFPIEVELFFEQAMMTNYFDYQPWIMAMFASVLVGLSGIFPLLVIPVDETATLKNGAGAKTLRVLLSFAVGGLLGDVFLHLLPEVWGNRSNTIGSPSIYCGLWVLAGLLAFIIIEKVFSHEKEEASDDKPDEPVKIIPVRRKKSSFILHDFKINSSALICEESVIIEGEKCANLDDSSDMDNLVAKQKSVKQPGIQVSGYLNLMANMIDNFSHGLAVGGSFVLSTRVGIFTTFAILVHEIPHEVGDFAILLRAGFTRWDAAWAQLYTASAGIVGALTALVFSASSNSIETRTSWILPFTAGGFLHIALVTVLPELLAEKNPLESLKQMLSLATGITVMAIMTSVIEG